MHECLREATLLLVKPEPYEPYVKIKDTSLSLRVPKDLDNRLKQVARTLDLSKNDVARHAIRAALDAIEARGYQIEWPLKLAASPKIPDDVMYELQQLSAKDREGVIKTMIRKLREGPKEQYKAIR